MASPVHSSAAVPAVCGLCEDTQESILQGTSETAAGAGWQKRVSDTPNPAASHCGSGVRKSPGWEFWDLASSAASAASYLASHCRDPSLGLSFLF